MLSRGVRGLAAAALLVALAAIAAVSSASGASSATGTSATGTSSTTVVFIMTAAEPGLIKMGNGMKEEGAKYGYNIKVSNALISTSNQNSLMRTFASEHVKAIILDSTGGAQLRAGLTATEAAHVPVYVVYSPDSGPVPGIAVSLRANAGTQSTEAMIKAQGTKGSVLALDLPTGANCVSSANQFTTIMKHYPGWKITTQVVPPQGYAQTAEAATKAWLLHNPKGSGQLAVWGCWDDPVLGSAAALGAANRWDVKLYGQNTDTGSAALLLAGHYGASFYFDEAALGRHMVDLVHSQAGMSYSDIKPAFESYAPIEITPKNIRAMIKRFPELK